MLAWLGGRSSRCQTFAGHLSGGESWLPAQLDWSSGPTRTRARIRFAAELSHQSVSTFVLDAAGEKAERVIATSTATSVPSEFVEVLRPALGSARRATAAKRATPSH